MKTTVETPAQPKYNIAQHKLVINQPGKSNRVKFSVCDFRYPPETFKVIRSIGAVPSPESAILMDLCFDKQMAISDVVPAFICCEQVCLKRNKSRTETNMFSFLYSTSLNVHKIIDFLQGTLVVGNCL